jgi:hypothetical protein
MTPIADMVEAMLAKGVPAETIVLAVRAAELSIRHSTGIPVDAAAEKRRAWDRQRKRNKPSVPPEFHRNPPESAENAIYLSTKKDSEEETKKERAKRKVGAPIPPDWKPNEQHAQEAIALGRDLQWMQEQATDLRLWGKANEHRSVARKLDWNATFSGWMRRAAKQSQRGGQPLTYREQKQKDWDDARKALRASIERDEREASSGSFDGLFPALGGGE